MTQVIGTYLISEVMRLNGPLPWWQDGKINSGNSRIISERSYSKLRYKKASRADQQRLYKCSEEIQTQLRAKRSELSSRAQKGLRTEKKEGWMR